MFTFALASLPALAATSDEVVVAAIRDEWAVVQAAVDGGTLSKAELDIGGGQNPAHVTVHWTGGSLADFEADPYAEPFVVRRVVQAKILPAVGPASVSFWYGPDGSPIFALAEGPDIVGLKGLDLHPRTEVRAWFSAGRAVRLQLDEQLLPSESPAAGALYARAVELRQALEALAR